MSRLSFLPLALLFCVACSHGDAIIDETHTFSTAWNRFSDEKFVVTVSDIESPYDIYCEIVVDTQRYRQASLPINVNVITSFGERRMFRSHITLRDRDALWKGEWRDNKLVVDQCIRDAFSFNRKGVDTVKIGQATQYYDISGIESLRLHIHPTKIEYPE